MAIKNIVRTMLVVAVILLAPLVAMQFTGEVNWSPSDFIVMGALLLGVSFTYEFVSNRIKTTANRVVVGTVLATLFLLIWAELAVGIFGSPFAGS